MFDTPILVLAFNRPDQTRELLKTLELLKPLSLFVVVDGPRNGVIGDVEKCKLTRDIFNNIEWECDVRTLFRAENLGCRFSVSNGLKWFFSQVPYGIILEDDVRPNLDFFYFCRENLKRFSLDKSVLLLSGNSFKKKQLCQKENNREVYSYFFTKYPHIWGWASWSDRFVNYDVNVLDWPIYKQSFVTSTTTSAKEVVFWCKIFDDLYAGMIDTWDYQLNYMVFKNSMKCICPEVNLVSNSGFGMDSTHTKDLSHPLAKLRTFNLDWPLRHRIDREILTENDKYVFDFIHNPMQDNFYLVKLLKRIRARITNF
jgi:hypothetical protein